jgi:hypothetical protein
MIRLFVSSDHSSCIAYVVRAMLGVGIWSGRLACILDDVATEVKRNGKERVK